MLDHDTSKQLFVVGIGGTLRSGSSTELAIRGVLKHVMAAGAETTMMAGVDLNFPIYTPGNVNMTAAVAEFLRVLRRADAIVIGSPGYHGGISGLVKNALDYVEETAKDEAPYFEGRPVGCISTGAGWQGANSALQALRSVTHALRGWPTPLGIALNSRNPLFSVEGESLDEGIEGQFRVMAQHILQFYSRSR
jgi:FMN reductase